MDSTSNTRKLFLVIEDNELCAKLFADTLRAVHPTLDIRIFKDAVEAFKFAKVHQPDAIHVDCQLPEHSGVAFLAWCDAIPRLAAVPKMMVTCFLVPWGALQPYENVIRRDDPEVIDMLEGGVIEGYPTPQKYFRKPIALDAYLAAAAELLGFGGPTAFGEITRVRTESALP